MYLDVYICHTYSHSRAQLQCPLCMCDTIEMTERPLAISEPSLRSSGNGIGKGHEKGGLVGGHWSGKFGSIPSLAVTPLRSWARGSQEAGLTQPRAHSFAQVR